MGFRGLNIFRMVDSGPLRGLTSPARRDDPLPRPAPLLLALLAGCSPAGVAPRPGDAVPPPVPELAARFDPAACGTVRGRVTWSGPVPSTPDLLGATPAGEGYAWVSRPNPFAPAVDKSTGGLANALVWLDGVDPTKSRPWDLPAVAVELRDTRFATPDGKPFTAGVVRTGGAVSFVSRDGELHAARARGAAFFTLPLPKRDSPLARPLPTPGVVELTSGAGYYWMAADVLVTDTPYAAVTGTDGAFTLPAVPAGAYMLRVRVRDWRVTRAERDPETGLHFRQEYAPPLLMTAPVAVTADRAVEQYSVVNIGRFPDPAKGR